MLRIVPQTIPHWTFKSPGKGDASVTHLFYQLLAVAIGLLLAGRCAAAPEAPAFGRGPQLEQVAHVQMEKARSIVFRGDTAYVAQNLDGMTQLDISNPRKPRVTRRFAPEELQPVDLEMIENRYLVVADRFRGLVVWDVRRADRPTSISQITVPGIATHVDVGMVGKRRIAAVACAGEGLVLVDTTRLHAPKVAGQFKMRVDFSRRVQLDGNIAYLADHFDGGLKVINIANPESPEPVFQLTLRGFCESVAVQDDLLLVNYRRYGMRFFHIQRHGDARDEQTTPDLKLLSTVVQGRSQVRGMWPLPDGNLLVANDMMGMQLYNAENPAFPVLQDEVFFSKPEDAAQSCAEHDGYVYVPSWDGGLRIFRIESPESGS